MEHPVPGKQKQRHSSSTHPFALVGNNKRTLPHSQINKCSSSTSSLLTFLIHASVLPVCQTRWLLPRIPDLSHRSWSTCRKRHLLLRGARNRRLTRRTLTSGTGNPGREGLPEDSVRLFAEQEVGGGDCDNINRTSLVSSFLRFQDWCGRCGPWKETHSREDSQHHLCSSTSQLHSHSHLCVSVSVCLSALVFAFIVLESVGGSYCPNYMPRHCFWNRERTTFPVNPIHESRCSKGSPVDDPFSSLSPPPRVLVLSLIDLPLPPSSFSALPLSPKTPGHLSNTDISYRETG